MRARSVKITRAAIVALLPLLVGIPLQAQTDQDWVYGDDYQPGNFGRVRHLENGVTLLRAAVDPGMPPVEDAAINAPIFPGDTVRTDYDQRTEIELAGGSLVRADRASEVTFFALPDPYAEFADNTILQLSEGTIQITAGQIDLSHIVQCSGFPPNITNLLIQ